MADNGEFTGKVFCAEKAQLLKAFQEASEAYAAAIGDIISLIGSSSTECEKVSKTADELRVMTREARDRLDAHIADHQC